MGAIGTCSSFAAYHRRVDFEDSPELAEFRAEVRSFLDEHAEPRRGDDRDWSRNGASTDPAVAEDFRRRCHEWQLTLFRSGWAGLTWPEAFGGRGLSRGPPDRVQPGTRELRRQLRVHHRRPRPWSDPR